MRYRALLIWLSALVAVLFLASLLIGASSLGPRASLGALISGDGAAGLVMREIRLPRAILGLLVGAALGLSGAAMQGFLRNPLAEPGLIGTSGAAALGAVIAIHTGAYAAFALALPLAALAGAGAGGGLAAGTCRARGAGADADTGGHRAVGFGGGADGAGAEPCPQPLCGRRNRVLADGVACRPLDAACGIGGAVHRAWRADRCCGRAAG